MKKKSSTLLVFVIGTLCGAFVYGILLDLGKNVESPKKRPDGFNKVLHYDDVTEGGSNSEIDPRYEATYHRQTERVEKNTALMYKKRLIESSELANLLNLTKEQIASLKEFCDVEMEIRQLILEERNGLITEDEKKRHFKETGVKTFRSNVMDILDDEQKALYSDYLEDRDDNSISGKTVALVNRLPQDVGIDDIQKDEIFKKLFLLEKSRYAGTRRMPNSVYNEIDVPHYVKVELEVMSEVLNEEQMVSVIEKTLQRRVRLENGVWMLTGN